MNELGLFFSACGISLLGSLQLGPVNSEVLRYGLRGKRKEALLTGLGGSIPEIPYAILAALLIPKLEALPWLKEGFLWLFVGVITFMGVRLLVKKRKDFNDKELNTNRPPFLVGFFLASLNPQLIFFWSGVLVGMGYTSLSFSEIAAFSLGTAVGALILQCGVALLGNRLFQSGRLQNFVLVDRILGIVLICLGLLAILQKFF